MMVEERAIALHQPVERTSTIQRGEVVLFQDGDALDDQLRQQRLLGVEVVVKGALGKVDALGDVLDAGAVKSAITEQDDGGLQQGLARQVLFALTPTGHGRSPQPGYGPALTPPTASRARALSCAIHQGAA